jgi:tRNA A-37 threonylcarbamoyl transferase component Bud32/tetratricopeptide (TPR) repeat protein
VPAGTVRCVDADLTAAYVAHALTGEERAAVDEHVDVCAACRRLLSEAVRETADDSLEPAATEGALPRGARLGPYIIEDVLDAGGMGMVYAARDPRLGRLAAIKALRTERTGADLARVLAEAAAMARLAHPNVVAIYDVLERGDRVYLAMELVRGRNLRQWLADDPRTWRDVVDAFVDAGEGLVAVHDAGLVHRDIKPSNLLRGDDGRVRLADFGLAVATDRDAAGRAGAVGTPAYMSPEQRRGEPVDARSDQYAFCVALHEALRGAAPDRRRARIPRRIRLAIERGRRADPAARFSSVRALLGELRAGRRSTRRAWIAAALVVVVAGACAVAAHRALSTRSAMAACEAGAPLVAIWDDPRRHEIERALRSTGTPYAVTAWPHVQRSLDDWAAAYAAERHAACAATWQGDQPVARLEARLDCLAERRGELRELADQLARADATTASYAVSASRLRSPAACATAELSSGAASIDGVRVAQLAALRDTRARIRALVATGHARDALPLARAGLADATRAADAPGRADALFQLGWVETEISELDAGETHLLEAITTAERAGNRRTRAEAWLRLLRLEHLRGRYDRLNVYRAQAEAAVELAGNDPDERAMLLQFVGTMLAAQGRRDEAKDVLRRALAANPDAPPWDRGTILESLALADEIAGDVRSALEPLAQSRALIEQGLGPSHPRVAHSLESLAVAWLDVLEPARARVEMARALAIFEPALGIHRSVAIAHDIMGFIELELADTTAAAAQHRQALQMWHQLGLVHPREAFCHAGLSAVALATGDAATAVSHAEQARTLGQRLADPKDRAFIALQLARSLQAAGRDLPRARALALEAQQIYTSVLRSPRDERDLARVTALLSAIPSHRTTGVPLDPRDRQR